ncbi:MAG TPA: heparan-alpha-glucosaminide N-acetyltransferase domain-containing protein [Candidatus Sulfotelmatobacter sp.]|nr:heparan-alpha-glucosaminide N-acetyltransferase domain-containing protein [Candidatus Sulfotelmatobacter sp.]
MGNGIADLQKELTIECAEQSAPVSPGPTLRPARIESVDLLRGLVMVIMVLDHVRDFAFSGTLHGNSPTDLTQATAAVFLTRWITHFCAPAFVFLAGTGAYLQLLRGVSRPALGRFLVTRGLWLIVLELTVVRFGKEFSLFPVGLGVLWVLGCSMIILAGLLYLPRWAVATFGLALVFGHNFFDRFGAVAATHGRSQPLAAAATLGGALWRVLHVPGAILPFGPSGVRVSIGYPLVPWIGVIALGYLFGTVYGWEAPQRRALLVRLGWALTGAFVVLRGINMYGDASPWSKQANMVTTLLSFLNVTKYPPSLLFLLMTLGPMIAALAWMERPFKSRLARDLVTFGRVPLFYYVMQWYVAHLLTLGLSFVAGKPTAYLPGGGWSAATPTGAGFGLGITYLIYVASIGALYPICVWYGGVKQRRRDLWWLSYL